ncbi:hypothetical protein JKP88DRAFT_242667 [Tribonema minus]|uniref:Uncharacterized protein n=1 Tax=Tribonema minus TaxID=303371 RepID=A0A835ZFK6_9STRA|nr:hypothetical protein JKP88DRAFT_242667 [Tribonema minus]
MQLLKCSSNAAARAVLGAQFAPARLQHPKQSAGALRTGCGPVCQPNEPTSTDIIYNFNLSMNRPPSFYPQSHGERPQGRDGCYGCTRWLHTISLQIAAAARRAAGRRCTMKSDFMLSAGSRKVSARSRNGATPVVRRHSSECNDSNSDDCTVGAGRRPDRDKCNSGAYSGGVKHLDAVVVVVNLVSQSGACWNKDIENCTGTWMAFDLAARTKTDGKSGNATPSISFGISFDSSTLRQCANGEEITVTAPPVKSTSSGAESVPAGCCSDDISVMASIGDFSSLSLSSDSTTGTSTGTTILNESAGGRIWRRPGLAARRCADHRQRREICSNGQRHVSAASGPLGQCVVHVVADRRRRQMHHSSRHGVQRHRRR